MKKYIYALAGPDGAPRYIGESIDPKRRVLQHRCDGNEAMKAWLRQLTAQGIRPRILILDTCERAASLGLETRWICRLSRRFVLLNGRCRGRKNTDPSLLGRRKWGSRWKEILAA